MSEPTLITLPRVPGHHGRQCVHCGAEGSGALITTNRDGDTECADGTECATRVLAIGERCAKQGEPVKLPKPLYDVVARAWKRAKRGEAELRWLSLGEQREAREILEDVRKVTERQSAVQRMRAAVDGMESAKAVHRG